MPEGPTLRVLAWPGMNARQNPYNRLLYTAMTTQGATIDDFSTARLLRGRFDLLHLHWPNFRLPPRGASWKDQLVALHTATLVMLALLLSRVRGQASIWTIHNLQAHDTRLPALARAYDRLLVRLIHGHVSLSNSAQRAAYERFPHLRQRLGFVIPHGHYRDSYAAPIDRDQARRELGLPLDAAVLLAFGLIRPYKQIVPLIDAFTRANLADAVLVIAGKPADSGLAAAVERAAAANPNVRLALRFIPDEETHRYFSAADLAVNPATRALNSGSALLALSFGVPVLMAESGVASDLRAQFGDRLVRCFGGELDAQALSHAVATLGERPPYPEFALRQLDWPVIAEQTIAAFASFQRSPMKGAPLPETPNL